MAGMARGRGPGGTRSLRWAFAVALALLLASVLLAASRAAPPAPVGIWLTQDRDGVIEILPCGAALCGRIVGVTGRQPDGSLPLDTHGRSQCGLAIVTGVRPGSGDRWAGQITDPETDRTYDIQLWLDQAGRLHLRGYVLVPLFGATQVWTPFRGAVPKDCRMRRGGGADGGVPAAG